MSLHNLKLHCSIEGKTTLDYAGASSVCHVENVSDGSSVASLTLETIRTVEIKFFLVCKHLLPLDVPCLVLNRKFHSCDTGGRVAFEAVFLFLKPFSPKCRLMVLVLQSATIRSWYGSTIVSCLHGRVVEYFRLAKDQFFGGSTTWSFPSIAPWVF